MVQKVFLVVTVLVTAFALGIGIIIGYFGIKKNDSKSNEFDYSSLTKQADQETFKKFIDSVNAERIRENLRNLTSRPHMAGLPEDKESAEFIEQRWKEHGLTVFKPKYNVLLSYPNDSFPNRVSLKNPDGTTFFQTNGTEKVYDENQPKTVNPFLAYTPGGTVSSSKLYYANYGRLEDLQALAAHVGASNLTGSIMIIRYGKLFRGDKVMHAQQFGAIGAILYNDPKDYAPFGITPNETYDQKWYMPPTGAQRGSTYTSNGDPLTPFYPSKAYMPRVRDQDVSFLPKIPAHPIGYEEATRFLESMAGDPVNNTWQGSLPGVTYWYGGQLMNNMTVEIVSHNRNERRDAYNVIGIMKGSIEPDRYVLIGNHRDAWSLGSIDPTSGTATLLEITRVLGEMHRQGFRPRRSLMFCSWGAEEYGLIGSVEFVQEYVKVLGARIVSYLNLDVAVEGNFTVDVKSSPMLFDAVVQASMMVPSAYDSKDMTVYNKWMVHKKNEKTNEPEIAYGLGSGSDFLAFDQIVGSSNFDASYTFNPKEHLGLGSYPLYHTSYEVFPMMEKFVDPKFEAHQTMGRLTGVLALILAESPILPLNVTRYGTAMQEELNQLKKTSSANLTSLEEAIKDFVKSAQNFIDEASKIDEKNPYSIRIHNDRLLELERAFLNPLGQGGDYSDIKHVIYAPAKTNKYAANGFPNIGDVIGSGNAPDIEREVAIATYFVRGALSTLKQFDNFIETEP